MFNKSTKLDRILTKCIKAIDDGKWTVEDCLNRYAPYRSELEPMLRVALKLRRARNLQPSDAYRSKAQSRLHTRLQAARRSPRLGISKDQKRVWNFWKKLGGTHGVGSLSWALPLLLVSLITAGAGGVLAYSVDHSKPGDLLYNLDRAIEKIRIQYENDAQQVVRLHLQFASERLEELNELVEDGDTSELTPALENYKEQIVATTPLITDAYAAGEDLVPLIEETTSILTNHEAELENLVSTVPNDVATTIRVTIKDIKNIQIFMTSPSPDEQPMAKDSSAPTSPGIEGDTASTPSSVIDGTPISGAAPEDGATKTASPTAMQGLPGSPEATPTPTYIIYATATVERTNTPIITSTPTPTPTPTPTSTSDGPGDKYDVK
jgi:hypothetical protein